MRSGVAVEPLNIFDKAYAERKEAMFDAEKRLLKVGAGATLA